MDEPRRILVLTADAGFGHRAAANAVADALAEQYGKECDVEVVNPLGDERAPLLIRRTQDDYDQLVLRLPELYSLTYQISDWELPVSLADAVLMGAFYEPLRERLRQHQPDAIVSTHPYYQPALGAIFALGNRFIPLITVVTDFASVHRVWFHDEVDLFAVPTEMVASKAREAGIPPERISVTGLPVNPLLAREVDKGALRTQLGLSPDRCVVLVAGSRQVRGAKPASLSLNHSALPLELVLVAGGDEALKAAWDETRWMVPAQVHGFVSNMAELMQAADIIVCKAGGLIVAEALAAGLPILLIEVIKGQETGNAEWVVASGAGEIALRPDEVLRTVLRWLDDDCMLLRERAGNARAAGRPAAAKIVASLAWQLAITGPPPREHRLLFRAGQLRELLAARGRPRDALPGRAATRPRSDPQLEASGEAEG